MKILYIYRNPDMGFSIGKVFHSIEEEMRKYAEVDAVYMPASNYKPIGLWKNIYTTIKAAKRKKYDIVHITGSEHYLIPFLHNHNVIVTVHDLGFFTTNKLSLRTLLKYGLWIKTLPMAACVTFISEKSKREAERFVRLKRGQAVVIHNPVGKEFIPYQKDINTKCPIILHIGTTPNKNLENTAVALRDVPCLLRIVGKLSDEQKTVLNLYKIHYEVVKNLTDKEILQEYINCDYVNFPSLYEGFGMPIIEGQAIGRPVLTSNISPMAEIAGYAAKLVTPTSPENIREGYMYLQNHAHEYIQKGFDNVKRFSIEKIIYEYLNLYKRTVNNNKNEMKKAKCQE